MPMSNSESRKRVAELAAGSGDETPEAAPCRCIAAGVGGTHWPSDHPVQPPAPEPSSDLTRPGDVSRIGPETDTPPAPDPDETCPLGFLNRLWTWWFEPAQGPDNYPTVDHISLP